MFELTLVVAISIAVMIFVIPAYVSAARLGRLSGVEPVVHKKLASISLCLSLHPLLLLLAFFVGSLKNHVLVFGWLISGGIYLIMAGVVIAGIWKGSSSFKIAELCCLMILGVFLMFLYLQSDRTVTERYQSLKDLDQKDELVQIMKNF